MKNYDLTTINDYISSDTLTKYTYGIYRKQKNEKIAVLEAEKIVLEATAKSIKAIIADYEKTPTVILPSGEGQPVEIIVPSAQYYNLLNEIIRIETEIAKVSEKIKLTSLSLEKISGQNADSKSAANEVEFIEVLLKNLNAEYNDLAQKASETINEFYEKEYMASAVRTTIPPVSFTKSLSDMHALFVFAVTALAGFSAALIETGIRIYYEKKRISGVPKAAAGSEK